MPPLPPRPPHHPPGSSSQHRPPEATLPIRLPGTPTLLVDFGVDEEAAAALEGEGSGLGGLHHIEPADAHALDVSRIDVGAALHSPGACPPGSARSFGSDEPGAPHRALFGRGAVAAAEKPPTVLRIAGVGDVVSADEAGDGDEGCSGHRVAVADLGAHVLEIDAADMAGALQAGGVPERAAVTPAALVALCPLLRDMDVGALGALAAAAQVLRVVAQETVLRGGELPQGVALVAEGSFACVCRPPLGAVRPPFAGMGEAERSVRVGEVAECGLSATLAGAEVWGDLVAETDGLVVLLPADLFRGLQQPPMVTAAVAAAERAAREAAVAAHASALAVEGLPAAQLDGDFAALLVDVVGGRVTAAVAVDRTAVFPALPGTPLASEWSSSTATPPSRQSSDARRRLVTPATTLSTEPSAQGLAPPPAAPMPLPAPQQPAKAPGGDAWRAVDVPQGAPGFKESVLRVAEELQAARPVLPPQALEYIARGRCGQGHRQRYTPAPQHTMRALARTQHAYEVARDQAETQYAGIQLHPVPLPALNPVDAEVMTSSGEGGRVDAAAEVERLEGVSMRLAVPPAPALAPAPRGRGGMGSVAALQRAPTPVPIPPDAAPWEAAERAVAAARAPEARWVEAAPAQPAPLVTAAADAPELLHGTGSLGWAGMLKMAKVRRRAHGSLSQCLSFSEGSSVASQRWPSLSACVQLSRLSQRTAAAATRIMACQLDGSSLNCRGRRPCWHHSGASAVCCCP